MLALVSPAAAGQDPRVGAGSLSAVVPPGWHARVRVEADGSSVLEAGTRPLPRGWALAANSLRTLRHDDALVSVAEVGNRPGTGGFLVVRRPPRLHAAALRRDPRLAGVPAVWIRFALRGRSFALAAAFGSDPPDARALREANALVQSLRVRPGGVDAATRARLRRPLRPLPSGCVPAPPARVKASIAWPVGRAPAYVALGTPGGVALLRDDVRREGRYLHKTLWAIAPSYGGPLLIRGIGRRGRLGLGTGRARELVLPAAGRARAWRYGPSTTALPGPGCYAFQVDGTSFTRTIVFRARL